MQTLFREIKGGGLCPHKQTAGNNPAIMLLYKTDMTLGNAQPDKYEYRKNDWTFLKNDDKMMMDQSTRAYINTSKCLCNSCCLSYF